MNRMIRMAVAAASLIGLSTAARAADLGGNCCSDLEERISELEATTARKGNRKVKLTVSGHVNEALLWVDGPGVSKKTVINNTNDQSRFRFVGEAKINADWSAGFLMEMGTAVAGYSGAPSYDVGIRHSAWYLDNKSLGRVWVGKTSTATDGIAEIDLSAASIASTRLSLESLSGAYLNGASLPFDGNREEVLKYVSPTLGGFTASAAWYSNRNDAWDAAIRYAGEFAGIRIAGGVGYRKEDDLSLMNAKSTTLNGSGSIMHIETGLFANASYGDMKGLTATATIPLADIKAMHFQSGIERNWLGFGKTTLFGEWAKLSSKTSSNSTDMWGVGAVQGIDAAALDIYVSYRDFNDFNTKVGIVGGIIRF